MQTWQKNLGTALSALGTSMVVGGIIPMTGLNPTTHTTVFMTVSILGGVFKLVGSFINDLFGVAPADVQKEIQSNNLVMHGANSPALPPIVPNASPVAVSKAPLIRSKP